MKGNSRDTLDHDTRILRSTWSIATTEDTSQFVTSIEPSTSGSSSSSSSSTFISTRVERLVLARTSASKFAIDVKAEIEAFKDRIGG